MGSTRTCHTWTSQKAPAEEKHQIGQEMGYNGVRRLLPSRGREGRFAHGQTQDPGIKLDGGPRTEGRIRPNPPRIRKERGSGNTRYYPYEWEPEVEEHETMAYEYGFEKWSVTTGSSSMTGDTGTGTGARGSRDKTRPQKKSRKAEPFWEAMAEELSDSEL